MHPPFQPPGFQGRGVQDRACPCLGSRQISLNVISAAAHFIVSGLLESIWHPLKAKRWGAIMISKIKSTCRSHTGSHAQ